MAHAEDLIADVPRIGLVVSDGSGPVRIQVLDPLGEPVMQCMEYLVHCRACGMADSSLKAYADDLLRWHRYLWAINVAWDSPTRDVVRQFVLWMKSAAKTGRREPTSHIPGSVNLRTGKRYPGGGYAPATINKNLSVISAFYEFHIEEGDGRPLVNPVPVQRGRNGGRVFAHHNPMDEFRPQRRADFRQKQSERLPRSIPDEEMESVFAEMTSHRDRALLEFWLSSAARPQELISVTNSAISVPDQTVTVIRKGSRAEQSLPASNGAFQWYRLYWETELDDALKRPGMQAWWTLRKPWRPLTYDAMRAVFRRANAALGTNWTLHDLRHTAALRMADDPNMSLVDIQHILGHAWLTTTQRYLRVRHADALKAAHVHLQQRQHQPPPAPAADVGYAVEDLAILFGAER